MEISEKTNKWLLPALFCSGAAALIYQIAWIRPIGFVYFSSIYLVSIITTTFMLGLAIGGYLMWMGRLADNYRQPLLIYAIFEVIIGLYGICLLEFFTMLPGFNQKLLSIHDPLQYHAVMFFSIIFLLGVPTTLMGATFPIAAKAYIRNSAAKGISDIYTINNLGAITGALLCGFILLPEFGVRGTTLIAASLNLAAALLVVISEYKLKYIKACVGIVCLFLALGFVTDYSISHLYRGGALGLAKRDYLGTRRIVFEKEGKLSTVAVVEEAGSDGSVYRLLIGGQGSSSTRFSDVRVSVMLGFIPRWPRPELSNALVIGFGVGGTARALANGVDTTTVEIEPRVIEAASFFEPLNSGILTNPNHRIIYNDARNFLLRTEQQFDIVVNHPLDPNQAFSSLLFTHEFFELVKSRLSENGFYVQWIPLYSMSKQDFSALYSTLAAAFSYQIGFINTHEAKELIVVCSRSPIVYDETVLRERFAELLPNDRDILNFSALESADMLFNLKLFTESDLEKYRQEEKLLTDDHPYLEFRIALNSIRAGTRRGEKLIRELGSIREGHVRIR